MATGVFNNFVDIIWGDFNTSLFDETDRLFSVLASYNQIVKKPTHISGSLLDHVYLNCEFLKEFDVQNDVVDVYFSDHDAVQIKFSGLS